jgi:hypothetical protein
MTQQPFSVEYDRQRGLALSWAAGHGVDLDGLPIRVRIKGSHLFRVWSQVDSGEGPPLWAEPDLDLLLFGPDSDSPQTQHRLDVFEGDDAARGCRATATHERVEVALEMRLVNEELEFGLSVTNPQALGKKSLPLCFLELSIGGLTVGSGAVYENAHAYGGRTHGWGKVADLGGEGVPFIHGCIGQAFPLAYLHHPETGRGLQFEFMMDGRPTAWLRPGGAPDHAAWSLTWPTERLLEPCQTHTYGGRLRLRAYEGRPVEMIWKWRDEAESRYGLETVPTPHWARRANIIEFNTDPKTNTHPFDRLDDPRVLELLKTWKAMGYTAIFTVGHNNTGTHFLSPYDYEPGEDAGGVEGEKQYLEWAHELGFKPFLWVTTVGMERRAPEVAEHPDWWTHRPDGSLFYAWDSTPETNYVGYAPDGDPMSAGWREWLRNEVTKLIRRGFDGIFIDGCIPRAGNHARWDWPGRSRNGVPDQVVELAEHLRGLGPDLALLVEDDGLYAQACCEVTQGRYTPVPPYFKKAHWDHGMGGGPKAAASPPKRIPPEKAREYLLLRYASRLPGLVCKEGNEGFYSEETRPWGAQMLLAGMVPKTHSPYVDDVETWRPMHDADDPPEEDRAPEHRRKGHEEFVRLLRLCRDEPLIREAPISIEAAQIAGDAAVVGLLRPAADRALLAVIQFAGRPATIDVRLAEPIDVPRVERADAGAPHERHWHAREIMRSMVDPAETPEFDLPPGAAARIEIGPYGFRVFELT